VIETQKTKMNSRIGNVNGVGRLTNIARCIEILHPTQMPMSTPEKLEEMTRIKAS